MKTRSEPPRYTPLTKPVPHADGERLQKILAAAGHGSRRDCEELILAGRVEVDRRVVTTLGTKANPHAQEIRIDGEPLAKSKLIYFMVNKPPGVVTSNADPAGRPRVIDLVPDRGGHLYPVGRLDLSSEGLILVTNDGELANRLTHPRYGVEKTYHVEVAGRLDSDQLRELRRGVHLAEGFAKVVGATIKKQMHKSTLLEVVLDEGKNREIRRVLARVGHKVMRLKRIAIGPLRLGDLPAGGFRSLSRDELEKLRDAARGLQHARPKRRLRRTGKIGHAKKPGSGRKASQRRPPVKTEFRGTGPIIGADILPAPRKPRFGVRKPGPQPKGGRKS